MAMLYMEVGSTSRPHTELRDLDDEYSCGLTALSA
jgi:hypothetical protein